MQAEYNQYNMYAQKQPSKNPYKQYIPMSQHGERNHEDHHSNRKDDDN